VDSINCYRYSYFLQISVPKEIINSATISSSAVNHLNIPEAANILEAEMKIIVVMAMKNILAIIIIIIIIESKSITTTAATIVAA